MKIIRKKARSERWFRAFVPDAADTAAVDNRMAGLAEEICEDGQGSSAKR